MAHAVDGIASEIELLSARVRELESRVSALENQSQTVARDSSVAAPDSLAAAPSSANWRGLYATEFAGGAVPILGKAVLGIAGAYLLRAVAESGYVPKLLVLTAAIVYAGVWLVWAVRSHANNRFASAAYAITSSLILSPMLWESTVRFQVLAPAWTAAVLVAFVILALTLSWKPKLQLIPWIAVSSAIAISIALIIGTHELVTLCLAVLANALATEAVVAAAHPLSVRPLAALAADFTIWLLVYVMTSSDGVPEAYRAASSAVITLLCALLLGIYALSIGISTLSQRKRITLFEICQGVLAIALAFFGILRATHNAAALVLGAVCLALAAVSYWGTLLRFSGEARNRRVFAYYAATLLLAGTFLLFSSGIQTSFLCFAALASSFLYVRTKKLSLGIHISVYLAAAALVSSLGTWMVAALTEAVPSTPFWNGWMVIASAVGCYFLGFRQHELLSAPNQRNRRLLWLLPAMLVAFAASALVVVAIVWLSIGHLSLNASRLSVIRTLVNCALALALGYLGSHWKRMELSWIAYTAVSFGTLKLLFEDFRFGNNASLVVSLLCYGLVLILLPRITRRRLLE